MTLQTPFTLIDGKSCAAKVREAVSSQVRYLRENHHLIPGLAVVMLGNNPASEVYVKNKIKQTEAVGMLSFHHHMPAETQQRHLLQKIETLNNDPKTHGILVQLPLPPHINEQEILQAIDPLKDVDGFHMENVGMMSIGMKDALIPCTPQGCMILLSEVIDNFEGKKAVIIGRSNTVGRPMAALLLQKNCTTTVVHSKTVNIEKEVQEADILVAAVGRPHFVKKDWVKPGAVVIDVGINRIKQEDGNYKLVGDVDFDAVKEVASAITPVPGGVGPMTIACLLKNTVKATCLQRGIDFEELP